VNTQYLLFADGGAIHFRVRSASGLSTAHGPALAVDSWSHIVGTFDGAVLRIYVNGALVASANSGAPVSGSGPALIGRWAPRAAAPASIPSLAASTRSRCMGARSHRRACSRTSRMRRRNVTTARVTIEVRPTAGGTLTNVAQVSGAQKRLRIARTIP
jgi:hypothetical protein